MPRPKRKRLVIHPPVMEGLDYHTDEFWYRCEACHKLLISETPLTYCSYCESDKIRQLVPVLPIIQP